MTCAFEDCRVLARLLGEHADQREALEAFEAERKPNADAIADMAVENFKEMRDSVGDPAFRYKKKIEQTLHRLFPEKVHPQYNLVSFSTVGYAEAQRRGRELERVLKQVVARLPAEVGTGMGENEWEARVREIWGEVVE